jgi:hypothetical protein
MEMILKTTPLNATTSSVLNSNTGLVLLTAGAESALTFLKHLADRILSKELFN